MIQLKTARLAGTFDFVSTHDDAIDRQLEDWEQRYKNAIETGDAALLPLAPGAKPTIFKLRTPDGHTGPRIADLRGFKAGQGGFWEAVQETIELSLVGIENGGAPFEPAKRKEIAWGICSGMPELAVELATAVWGRLVPEGNS